MKGSTVSVPTNAEGDPLPPNSPPPPQDDSIDWSPFDDRPTFELASWAFEKVKTSQENFKELMNILKARNIQRNQDEDDSGFFDGPDDWLKTIDAIEYGETPWTSFTIRYTGPTTNDSPPWQRETYTVYTRDTLAVVRNMLSSADFAKAFDYTPFKEFTGPHRRRWSNLMSGHWAWKQADLIAEDEATHGSMFCPIILGADKTCASIATGNVQFHPVYMSIGNVHNEMRRSHRDAVIPIAFLSIPKAAEAFSKTDEFKVFSKQLYHASLTRILWPLREGMTTPHVMLCPDGHYRKTIFGLGPFIADYPEQVVLSGIVSGWCPKCLSPAYNFDKDGDLNPRFRELSQHLLHSLDHETLWDIYGVAADVMPFTSYFPRADIHECMTPDLLHQMIKGTFKDHLVEWVYDYIHLYYSPAEADRVVADIDARIAAAPSFPGLRRFPQGRNFQQWTGNDSKALMKVFLPAIAGHIPDDIVKCIAAFLDFCYIARRNSHDTTSLGLMEEALARYHALRPIFERLEIRPKGFALPRQHALRHYLYSIRLFGSPNGLCSSITESKHIAAVKVPYRRSSKNGALLQMLKTNSRTSQLSAARVEFGRRGMLNLDAVQASRVEAGIIEDPDDDDDDDDAIGGGPHHRDEDDVEGYDGPRKDANISLSVKPAYTRSPAQLAQEIDEPDFPLLLRRFLHAELYPAVDAQALHVDDLVDFQGRVAVHRSAFATFYAPSEQCGPGGMHREAVRSTPNWRKEHPRYDTVLIQVGADDDPFGGFVVGRVKLFFKFSHDDDLYPCALVQCQRLSMGAEQQRLFISTQSIEHAT
ncbi:hypothetical protein EIP91_012080 [Steccherinum ochraceum]|uniref:Uncharacterized protein n=1 Tax=Steccherinum ochraceum TaxID=92696 RepID=A0A4R0RV87_9APHY|nr:hypothetical protein EIP91_012080 [Steccherinum ochraceum]